MGEYDSWSLNRLGRAARATTEPGRPPQYGLAFDLARADWDSETFDAFAADAASRLIQSRVALAQHAEQMGSDPGEVLREWEIIRNYNNYGIMGMTNDMFRDLRVADIGAVPTSQFAGAETSGALEPMGFLDGLLAGPSISEKAFGVSGEEAADTALAIGNIVKGQTLGNVGGLFSNPIEFLKNSPTTQAMRLDNTKIGGPLNWQPPEYAPVAWAEYSAAKGILTREQFETLPAKAQQYALQRAKNRGTLHAVAEHPLVGPVLKALDAAYYGIGTGFQMVGNRRRLLDDGWFDLSEWGHAHAEARQQSLGNSILNGVFEPFVGQDTIDRWQRDSAFYDLWSTGTEFLLGWYADPAVITLKGAGGVARFARGEMPLNIDGKLHTAVTQNLQRETVTIGGVRGAVGKRWANRIDQRTDGLIDFMRTHGLGEAEGLPMFHRRATNGSPLAYAWWHAANKFPESNLNLDDLVRKSAESGDALTYHDPLTLTKQMAYGDPKAWQDFNRIKDASADELRAWAPEGSNPQDFIDALEAATTRLPELQKEADDILKRKIEQPRSTGLGALADQEYNWLLDRSHEAKLGDVADLKETLRKYEGYDEWLSTFERTGPARVSRVDSFERRHFLSSSYGKSSVLARVTRPIWIQRANVVELDRPQTGFDSIRRTFEQLEHLTGRVNQADFDEALTAFARADTPHERYNVLLNVEAHYTTKAMAEGLGAEPFVVRALYDNVVERQNRVLGSFSEMVRSTQPGLFKDAPNLNQTFGAEMAAREGIDDLKLASLDDNGMATLTFKENGALQQITVPKEALDAKKARALEREISDPSQITNLFAPIDLRRFYYTLKRDPEVMHMLSNPMLRQDNAYLMQMIDIVGRRFNALWKPFSLFRLGWPQRMLMDESVGRGMSILGPVQWTRYYGGDAMRAANNAALRLVEADQNLRRVVTETINAKYGKGRTTAPLGPGPITNAAKRPVDSVIMHQKTVHSTHVPAGPKSPWAPDGARMDKIHTVLDEWDGYYRTDMARRAWAREFNRDGEFAGDSHVEAVRLLGGDPLDEDWLPPTIPSPDMPDWEAELLASAGLTPAQLRAYQRGLHLYQRGRQTIPGSVAMPKVLAEAQRLADAPLFRPDVQPSPVSILDPLTGDPVRGIDYAVPVPETAFPLPDNPTGYGTPGINDFMEFYRANAELLGSTGYRIMVTPDKTLYVARVFKQTKRSNGRQNAFQMLDMTGDRLFDFRTGEWHYAKGINDLTPAVEAAIESQRRFIGGVEDRTYEVNPSDPPLGTPKSLHPTEGKTLMHGTKRDLTAQPLRPRGEAPEDRGRLAGEGFYMTDDNLVLDEHGRWVHPGEAPDSEGVVISGYAAGLGGAEDINRIPEQIYSIRNSRTGRREKIYDINREISARDKEEWYNFAVENLDDPFGEQADLVQMARELLDNNESLRRQNVGTIWGEDNITWLDLFASTVYHPRLQRLVTRYLEEKKGVGVLRYPGGLLMGGRSHNAYVFLHPEDLEIQSAYAVTKRYLPMEEWLATGWDQRPLRPVPENRIHRIKDEPRNPMIRDLHTTHRQIEERAKELKAQGKGRFADPKYRALVTHEVSLMDGLGLEYRHNLPDGQTPNAYGQDWYVVNDPDRFNSMVGEAQAEKRSRDAFDAGTAEAGLGKMDFSDLDFEIDSPTRAILKKVFQYREAGKGTKTFKSSNGEKIVVPAAFAGHQGEEWRNLISSKGAIDILSEGHGGATQLMRNLTGRYKTYNPIPLTEDALKPGTRQFREASLYFEQWAGLANDRIAKSPIFQRLMNGASVDDVVKWLDETPAGAKIKREVKPEYESTWAWVMDHRQKLDYYVPSRKMQRILAKRRLDPSELRKAHDEAEFPTIYAPDIELLDNLSDVRKGLNWIVDRAWHGLGTVPVDVLSRHPFARAMYDLKMKSLIASTDSKWLDNALLNEYRDMSIEFAKGEVRKHLYDLVDQTNMADALRFISPFWGAQFEAMKKWARIVSDRPETVARIFNLQRAVYNNYVVVDDDGREVKDIDWLSYDPEHRIIFQVPESMKDTTFGKALATIGEAGVSLGSMNTVLQGEAPIVPGLGPLVTVPADKFMREVWPDYGTRYDGEFLYRWLFPVGRPPHGGVAGVLDQILPGWAKRLREQAEGPEGLSYANLFIQVAREMEEMNRKEGKPAPTAAQIEQQVDRVYALKVAVGLFAPFPVEWRPNNQFLIDAANELRDEHGPDWIDAFIAKYGETAAKYAIASSTATAGVPVTAKGMEEWAENKELIAEYPEWGGAIIGPNAYLDEFSYDAYRAQFDINLGPGDSTTLRQSRDFDDRQVEAERLIGWTKYRQFDAMIDAELQARGLTSITNKDAWDLLQLKRNWVSDMRERYPSWYADYEDPPPSGVYDKIDSLREWVWDTRFDGRPDIQGVRQYLMIRDQVALELDRYGAAEFGNSRSLQAEQNTELRNWFYDQIGALAQENPAFAEFYTRYLSNDTLERGSG